MTDKPSTSRVDEPPANERLKFGPIAPSPATPSPTAPATSVGPALRRTPLFEAINSARYSRQTLIRDIESQTGNTLLCIVAEHGQISRSYATAVVDLLHNVDGGTNIDLLLNSPGGDIDTAEKLTTLIRKKAGKGTVRVIVPDYAKSAATLIALGADQIVMSDTSELGPIDPQVTLPDTNGGSSIHSARSYIDAYEQHAEALRANPEDPVARLMLDKLDPAVLEKLTRASKRSTVIASELLRTAMVRDGDTADDIASRLSDTAQWHSHGQMIGHERCSGLGLTVTYLDPRSDLWEALWRLYCLQAYSLPTGGTTLFESKVASLPL
ncbi:hypothetical protein BH92_07695 [Rhodococcoides fascians A21d2]|uniref:SDH family Clp fold serine proteinase n=1 Tax=Nocardiaceae TaxID=85025 RepID=UPI0013EF1A29|nr:MULTISPECIES: ATP-dependent Clp protease proteolytic subunit [Rhodococcus]QIH99762.1 hypothetical protein BH92_07695 [Rhodococcus fascians A21d2]